MARRLSKVLNSIIRECQHAFFEGGQITDAILITNEVADVSMYMYYLIY